MALKYFGLEKKDQYDEYTIKKTFKIKFLKFRYDSDAIFANSKEKELMYHYNVLLKNLENKK